MKVGEMAKFLFELTINNQSSNEDQAVLPSFDSNIDTLSMYILQLQKRSFKVKE